MNYPIWLWAGFGALVLTVLSIDLGVFHRRAHEVGPREAAAWSAFWIALSLIFNLGVFLWIGRDSGLAFLTGYLMEKALSLDNIFVWLVIFSDFAVPSSYQHRVLFYGILGALLLRAAFIATGVTLLNTFHWMVYGFGVFLIITGIRIALRKDREIQPSQNWAFRLISRLVPITESYEGQRFFVRRDGRWLATPLILVLLIVETTDLVFALDSVPAILSITRDPFIVYTSNVFAILGLRALFFLLNDFLHRLRYLRVGLALVLGLVGIKMLISDFYHVPIFWSLAAITGILGLTVVASYLATRGSPSHVAKNASG